MRLQNHTITFPKGIDNFWKSDECYLFEDIVEWINTHYEPDLEAEEIFDVIYQPLLQVYKDYKDVVKSSEKLKQENNVEIYTKKIDDSFKQIDIDSLDTSNFKF